MLESSVDRSILSPPEHYGQCRGIQQTILVQALQQLLGCDPRRRVTARNVSARAFSSTHFLNFSEKYTSLDHENKREIETQRKIKLVHPVHPANCTESQQSISAAVESSWSFS
eukprot:gb/GECG01012247.1/.p1 GENE.gb/GECG01012247.1/~~gb/GECG01012247.1/.p1  ORF type:complete len:113 (+),score=3.40 gb/GECG01012247.1/:1-339(+)